MSNAIATARVEKAETYVVVLKNTTTRSPREVVVSAFHRTGAELAALPGDRETVVSVKKIDRLEALLKGKIFDFNPSLRDILLFFRNLSMVLSGGVEMVKALRLQMGITLNGRFRAAIAQVIGSLEQGNTLSTGFSDQSSIFSPTMCALVRAGEESGNLPVVLKDMASSLERSYIIFRKLKQAMIYPAVVMFACVGVLYVFSYRLVPALSGVYRQFGSKLPPISQMVVNFSNFLTSSPLAGVLPALFPVLLIIFWKRIYRVAWVQRLCLRVPKVGMLIRKACITKALRTMSMLASAKVNVDRNLELCSLAAGHVDYAGAFLGIRDRVKNGETLAEGFAKHAKTFGQDGAQIAAFIQSAQEAGTLDTTLQEIAKLYEDDLDDMSNNISKIIEPLIMVVIIFFVGFLLYAVYAPIADLSRVILKR